MHAHIHTYIHADPSIYAWAHTHIHTYTHTHILHIHTYMHTHTHVRTYVLIYLYMHTYTHTYILIYPYIHAHIHTYEHTQTHIQSYSFYDTSHHSAIVKHAHTQKFNLYVCMFACVIDIYIHVCTCDICLSQACISYKQSPKSKEMYDIYVRQKRQAKIHEHMYIYKSIIYISIYIYIWNL